MVGIVSTNAKTPANWQGSEESQEGFQYVVGLAFSKPVVLNSGFQTTLYAIVAKVNRIEINSTLMVIGNFPSTTAANPVTADNKTTMANRANSFLTRRVTTWKITGAITPKTINSVCGNSVGNGVITSSPFLGILSRRPRRP